MKPTSVAILVVVCGLIGTPSYAQGVVGVTGGIDVARFHASNCRADQEPCDLGNQAGFTGGVFVNFFPAGNSMYAIESAVQFAMKGGRSRVGNKGRNNFNYLEIPVLARVSASVGNVKPFLVLGPSFGLRLSAKDSAGSDLKDDLKAFDLGIAFGGGIELTPMIGVRAVFQQSLLDQFTSTGRENRGLSNQLFNRYHNRTFSMLMDITLKRGPVS